MNWISGMQNAIDYIEEHLTDEIDYEMAAEELIRTNERVIDVALKYGYETPESFSRAFVRFHGVTPTQARQGNIVKSFSRLSVKLILTGGNLMDYRIEKMEADFLMESVWNMMEDRCFMMIWKL